MLKSIILDKKKTNQAEILCTFSKITNEKIKKEIKRIKENLVDDNFGVDVKY